MFSNPGVASSRPERREPLDALLTLLVRGGERPARVLASVDVGALMARAEVHGVTPLVAEAMALDGQMPRPLSEAFNTEAYRYVAADLAREAELRRVLGAFAARNLKVLLLKGAHLAYAVYERSDLRPRIDTDLLVSQSEREAATDALREMGYESSGQVDGTLVMYQASFVKRHGGVIMHVIDLHWKIANPQVFSEFLSYEDLAAEALPLPVLGAGAWVPSNVHALIIACVHRVAHHHDTDRLIWLYDIHLLAGHLSEDDWHVFTRQCEAIGVTRVCQRSLERAAEAFGTALPAGLTAVGDANPAVESATAAFLNSNRRHLSVVVGDLRALPSWRDRLRLLSQHAFPSASYMRSSYAPASSAPLPVLYARRAVQGMWKWLARP